MLTELRITGLGVIDSAELELSAGLTVLTGETGAGKTMVVSGLSLLLGERADAGAIRPGEARALVEGRWRLPPESALLARAVDAGARVDDDGELIAMRSVSAQGRSRAHLGGTGVPVGLLAELGGHLVSMHSQSDQIDLLRPRRQLSALDAFAAALPGSTHADTLADYRQVYDDLQRVGAEHDELVEQAEQRRAERERLVFGLEEIEAVDPRPGEDRELAEESERLGHADDLRSAAAEALHALSGDELDAERGDDVLSLLGGAKRILDTKGTHDSRLEAMGGRLEEVLTLVSDLAADLSAYLDDVDADPARLAAVEQRRADLARLTRRYGQDADAVLAWAQEAAVRQDELAGDDARIADLAARRDELTTRLGALAGTLHGTRVDAAQRFAQEASAELAALAMPSAAVSFAIETMPPAQGRIRVETGGRAGAAGPDGVDTVDLLLAPHSGAPARPLAKGASGGELSRVMLACEVVLGTDSTVPTFVFDEVDAGVGGAAAVEVGRRLARLAQHGQVLVVTHLAQVAAFADAHLVVRKDDDGAFTTSGVAAVTGADREAELARMLGGDPTSDVALAHARELLAQAASAR